MRRGAFRPGWGTLLLGLPLVLMALATVGVVVALASRLSLDELARALTAPETRFALCLSLETSLAALVLALLLGLPTAWLLARRAVPGRALIQLLVDVPLVLPPLVVGVGLLFFLGPRWLGGPLTALGLDLLFSPGGIVVAQAFVATAVIIRASAAALRAVPAVYGAAAGTLRASPWDCWWSIELPLAAPGIAAGVMLAWARALGEFGATLMVAGATRLRTETLATAVYLNLATGETGVAVACALILLVVALTLLVVVRWLGPA